MLQPSTMEAGREVLTTATSRSSQSAPAFWFVCGLAVIEWLWIRWLGLRTEQVADAVVVVAFPLALSLGLDALGVAKRWAVAMNLLALWVAWMVLGCLLTYLTASFGMPLRDATFAGVDAHLGLDWVQWYKFVDSVPALDFLLRIAYLSMLPQVVLSLFFLSHAERLSEATQLWWSTITALIITCFISGLLPALCAWDYYQTAAHQNIHIPNLIAMREGSLDTLRIMSLKAIVTFPSFHAAMAVLLTYPYRKFKAFPMVVTWNILMLLSVPKHGGHYFIDVLAGITVAALAIWLVTERRSARAMAR